MILQQVTEIIAHDFHVKPETISLETRLREDLNVDSLDAVELIMTLEDKFGITIADSEATALKTVGDIVKYIESKK